MVKKKNKNKGRVCYVEGFKCIKIGICDIVRFIGEVEISLM